MQSVIIVDNDIWNAERLRKSFISMEKPYQVVRIFSNGKDALQYLQDNPTRVDFLITDICMPGFPELELIERMKKINKQLQCIILSAHKVFEYAQRAIELGVARYLVKPIQVESITQVLDSLTLKPMDVSQNEKKLILSKEVKYMKKEIDIGFRNVDMNDVAEKLGFSKEYLYRMFRREMNISVNSYLQNVRLAKAKEYLSETGKYKIYEICDMVGYDDQVYFSKLFKKKYDISPKDFQKYNKGHEQQLEVPLFAAFTRGMDCLVEGVSE